MLRNLAAFPVFLTDSLIAFDSLLKSSGSIAFSLPSPFLITSGDANKKPMSTFDYIIGLSGAY